MQQTGKRNLLNSGQTDLSQNAYWHLNAAIKFLSRFTPSQGKDQIYKTTLATGERGVVVPRLRFINNVSIEDAVEGETYLDYMDYHALRKLCYATPTVQSARPLYWGRNIRSEADVSAGITNGDFSTGDLTSWTTHTGTPTVVGGSVYLRGNNADPNDAIYQRLASYVDGDLTVSVDVESIEAGCVLHVVIGAWNTSIGDVTTISSTSYTTSGVKTITPGTDWDLIFIFVAADQNNLAVVNGISVEEAIASDTGSANDILVGPQSDQSYTVRVYGGQYPAKITRPFEQVWWMEKEEECVIDAFRLSLEGRLHRNAEGENQELSRLLSSVRQIQSDIHWEEAFGSNQNLRLGVK